MAICDLKKIKVDIKNKSYISDRECKQNDTLILNFSIWDDGVPADLTGYTCMLKANKSKKAIEIRDTTITGQDVRLQCPTSTTQFAGDLDLELFFINSTTGLQKTSFTISIKVDGSVIGDSDGNVPENIITPLQRLDENLVAIDIKITDAKEINNTLNNTKTAADNTNSTLNNAVNSANTAITNCNTAKDNVNNAITSANSTIDELKETNSQYTDHINNLDIHVTKQQKINWDNNLQLVQDLMRIVNMFIDGAFLVDENDNNIVDSDGNYIIG